MVVSLIATFEADGAASERLSSWFQSAPKQFMTDYEGILNVDIFVPDPEKTLFFDEGPPPAAMLQIEAVDLMPLQILIDSVTFKEMFLDEPVRLVPDVRPGFGVFESISVPIFGETVAGPRTAPLSFVVRYYGPMDDQQAFREFYVANHLPLLAKFPGIRNAFAYLPVNWRNPGLPESSVLLGNEVVFDSVGALNAAMQSDIMVELRDDSRQFPPFGHSTHHAMQRQPLLQ